MYLGVFTVTVAAAGLLHAPNLLASQLHPLNKTVAHYMHPLHQSSTSTQLTYSPCCYGMWLQDPATTRHCLAFLETVAPLALTTLGSGNNPTHPPVTAPDLPLVLSQLTAGGAFALSALQQVPVVSVQVAALRTLRVLSLIHPDVVTGCDPQQALASVLAATSDARFKPASPKEVALAQVS
jgi:hypothetical protein